MNRKQFQYDAIVQKQNLSSEIQHISNKIQKLKNIQQSLKKEISNDVCTEFKFIEITQLIQKYQSLLKVLRDRKFGDKTYSEEVINDRARNKTRKINFEGRRSRSVGNKIRYDTPRYPINVKALKKIIDIDCTDGIYSIQKWLDTNLTYGSPISNKD
jgi:hypothetical protein